MNILVLFTYKVSISDWKNSGIMQREFKLYKQISKNRDIKFSFITYGDENDQSYDLHEFNIHPLYSKINFKKSSFIQFFNSIRILKVFRKEIKDSEIIKTNQLNGAWIGVLAKLFFKKKLIVRTGYDIYYFSKMEGKSKLKLLFFYFITRLSLLFADYYIVSSNADKERLLINHGSRFNAKIIVNSNWVDYLESIKPFSDRSKTFITVGRLEGQKNYINLLENFSKTNIPLDIFGEGTKENILRKIIDEKKIPITLMGSIENKKLITKYQEYKYFILNSHYEGNPKVLLEAMSSGCVVFIRYNKNIEEIIKNQKNGFMYKSDEELRDLLGSIESFDLESISASARLQIFDNFTLHHHARRELELYKKLLPNSSFKSFS